MPNFTEVSDRKFAGNPFYLRRLTTWSDEFAVHMTLVFNTSFETKRAAIKPLFSFQLSIIKQISKIGPTDISDLRS